jgi:hypothetical protein
MWVGTAEIWYKRLSDMDEQRRARRVPVTFDVVLEAKKAHYVAETRNMSETGLFLYTKRAFPVGTVLRMAIGQPPDLPRVDAEGVVKRLERGEGVGVEFTKISPEGQKVLADYLNSRAPAEEAPNRA